MLKPKPVILTYTASRSKIIEKPTSSLIIEPTVSPAKALTGTRLALDWGSNSPSTQALASKPIVCAMTSRIDVSPAHLFKATVPKHSSVSQKYARKLPTSNSSDHETAHNLHKTLLDVHHPITLAGMVNSSDMDAIILHAGTTCSGDAVGSGSKSLSAGSDSSSRRRPHPDMRNCSSTATVRLRRGSISTGRLNLSNLYCDTTGRKPVPDIRNINIGPMYSLDTPNGHLNPSTDVLTIDATTLTDLPYSVGVSGGSSGMVHYGQSHMIKAAVDNLQVENHITYPEPIDNSEAYVLEETIHTGNKIESFQNSKSEELQIEADMNGVTLRNSRRVNMQITAVPVVGDENAIEHATVAPPRLKRHASVVFGSTRDPVGPSEDQPFGRCAK